MKNVEEIGLWEAIAEMERISRSDGEFSFGFYKHNKSDRTGGDCAKISRARLRKRTGNDKIEHSDHKLFFTDLQSGRQLNCWQILIIEFNGKKVII